ncbi:hypothetical protein BJX64DRAFT_267127 [Aspergillus heterothallicus]
MIGECLASGGKGYVHHHVVVVGDSVDLVRLKTAWQAVAEPADILRMSFYRDSKSRDVQATVHRSHLIQWSYQPVRSLSGRSRKYRSMSRIQTWQAFLDHPGRLQSSMASRSDCSF